MRVPVLARTWSMNWPLSVLGKKSWPSHGTSRNAAAAGEQKDWHENDPRDGTARQAGAGISRASRSKPRSKAALEKDQRIARPIRVCRFAFKRYMASVGTSVRERM